MISLQLCVALHRSQLLSFSSEVLSKEKRSQLLDAKRVRHSPAASPSHESEENLDDVTVPEASDRQGICIDS